MSSPNDNQNDGLTTALKVTGGILTVIAGIVGSKILYDNKEAIQDTVNSNWGVPLLIVGASAVGKSTLIDYLHPGSTEVNEDIYERTLPQGRVIDDFKAPTGSNNVRLVLKRDVPGESVALWRSVLQSNRPEGIALLISHQDDKVSVDDHVIAWNALLEILTEKGNLEITQNLKALHVFVNKIDLWCFEGISENKINEARRDIKHDFAKQIIATKNLSERYGFDYNDELHLMSLLRHDNVNGSFNKFIGKVLEKKRLV